MKQYGFPKAYKLCSKKEFSLVLSKGKATPAFPFKFIWLIDNTPSTTPVKIAISVPKRIHKHAVDRNKIRRKIRESVRHNIHQYTKNLQQHSKTLYCLIIYTHKKNIPSTEITEKIHFGFKKIFKNHESS
ncbi:MAG: ribonuclease P protein component [Bacteroidales bacterium]